MTINLITLGKNIKKLRETANLSQKHIADYLIVDQSLISKIETGERAISADKLVELSRLFCCSVEKMLSEDEVNPEFKIAFRTQKLNNNDLIALAQINKIALNLLQMDKLIGEK